MTTLWPVTYVYFDVLLLLAAALLAGAVTFDTPRPPSIAGSWTAIAAATLALVGRQRGTHAAGHSGRRCGHRWGAPSCDPVLPATSAREIGRSPGSKAGMRRSCCRAAPREPPSSTSSAVRASRPRLRRSQISALLNGAVVGTVVLPPGWNQISLAAPAQAWRIGVNELELFLSSSATSNNGDRRQVSVAIDRVTVR